MKGEDETADREIVRTLVAHNAAEMHRIEGRLDALIESHRTVHLAAYGTECVDCPVGDHLELTRRVLRLVGGETRRWLNAQILDLRDPVLVWEEIIATGPLAD